MAYLRKEKAAEIRAAIKKEFPAKDGWKFSITNRHLTECSVSILKAPIRLTEKEYQQVNHYYISEHHEKENAEVFQKITDIAMTGNHDRSDSQSDYFDVGWYFSLSVGEWDKPFIYTGKN